VGLLSGVLLLPLAPVRMTIAVAEQIRLQAEAEYYDPSRVRAQLQEVDRMREAGELDDDQAGMLEEELLDRLLNAPARDVTPRE
jgi:chorismate mutase